MLTLTESIFIKNTTINCKNLWAYVAIAFNKVDADRLKLVGKLLIF